MTSPFSAPATATGLDLKALHGALLILRVREFVKDVNTSFGSTDAIRADVDVLDGPQAGETFTDTLVFPKVLVSQLKPSVGGMVLGRLGQGQAKPGQSAPWVLAAATAEDEAKGVAHLTRGARPAQVSNDAPF
jgi:hypothetical protein